MGTVPHALIAAYGGDTVAAARAFAGRYAGEMNVTVLVDFDNDSVRYGGGGGRRAGRRPLGRAPGHLGAAGRPGLERDMGDGTLRPASTCRWPRAVRAALDDAGHPGSGSWPRAASTPAASGEFEAQGAPVDAYGVGSSLLRGQNDFTADVVLLDGEPVAKVGRQYRPSPRLELRVAHVKRRVCRCSRGGRFGVALPSRSLCN